MASQPSNHAHCPVLPLTPPLPTLAFFLNNTPSSFALSLTGSNRRVIPAVLPAVPLFPFAAAEEGADDSDGGGIASISIISDFRFVDPFNADVDGGADDGALV